MILHSLLLKESRKVSLPFVFTGYRESSSVTAGTVQKEKSLGRGILFTF
jgi:hypothetical protein